MALEHKLSRRQLLKVGAGTAAAAAILPMTGASVLAAPTKANGKLIAPDRIGTITYTQRDVPTRLGIAGAAAAGSNPTMGYLGGPGFPDDPTDLGPLVPLPGGWRELFEFLAGCGYRQIEFAGYNQNAGNPGGSAPNPAPGGVTTPESRAAYLAYGRTLRGFLDEFGLEAIGNHGFIPGTWFGPSSAGGTMSTNDYERFLTELEFGSILGTPFLGTGSDPTSANNRNIEPWTLAGEKWEALNELAADTFDIQIYPHNHSPAYNFLQDGPMVEVTVDRATGNPLPAPVQVRGESGKRLMEYYLEITDPKLCVIELDIYWAHVAQHQHRWYFDHGRQPGRERLRPARVRRRPDQAVPAVPRQGRRPERGAGRRRQRLQHRPVRGRSTSTSPRSSGARVPRAGTTPTTSRTARPAGVAIPASPCGTRHFSAANLTSLRG